MARSLVDQLGSVIELIRQRVVTEEELLRQLELFTASLNERVVIMENDEILILISNLAVLEKTEPRFAETLGNAKVILTKELLRRERSRNLEPHSSKRSKKKVPRFGRGERNSIRPDEVGNEVQGSTENSVISFESQELVAARGGLPKKVVSRVNQTGRSGSEVIVKRSILAGVVVAALIASIVLFARNDSAARNDWAAQSRFEVGLPSGESLWIDIEIGRVIIVNEPGADIDPECSAGSLPSKGTRFQRIRVTMSTDSKRSLEVPSMFLGYTSDGGWSSRGGEGIAVHSETCVPVELADLASGLVGAEDVPVYLSEEDQPSVVDVVTRMDRPGEVGSWALLFDTASQYGNPIDVWPEGSFGIQDCGRYEPMTLSDGWQMITLNKFGDSKLPRFEDVQLPEWDPACRDIFTQRVITLSEYYGTTE